MVYLKDHIETVKSECLNRNNTRSAFLSPALIDQAIEAQIKNNLRYNKKTGKTLDRCFGVASEYVNKKDIELYIDDSECAMWQFTGFVRNSASRIKRGYSAI